MLSKISQITAAVAVFSLLSGCAADPSKARKKFSSTTGEDSFNPVAELNAVRVEFRGDDFYSLVDPHPTTFCAGDARTYYNPWVQGDHGDASPLPPDDFFSSTTFKPDFIKNVSVDLTDASAKIHANNAFSCSYDPDDGGRPTS